MKMKMGSPVIGVLSLCLLLLLSPATAQSGVCDPLVPQNCLLPFPNNFWTKPVRNSFVKVVILIFLDHFYHFNHF